MVKTTPMSEQGPDDLTCPTEAFTTARDDALPPPPPVLSAEPPVKRPTYFTSMSAARHTDAELVRAIREVVVMILRNDILYSSTPHQCAIYLADILYTCGIKWVSGEARVKRDNGTLEYPLFLSIPENNYKTSISLPFSLCFEMISFFRRDKRIIAMGKNVLPKNDEQRREICSMLKTALLMKSNGEMQGDLLTILANELPEDPALVSIYDAI